jgi:hypothetical protein
MDRARSKSPRFLHKRNISHDDGSDNDDNEDDDNDDTDSSPGYEHKVMNAQLDQKTMREKTVKQWRVTPDCGLSKNETLKRDETSYAMKNKPELTHHLQLVVLAVYLIVFVNSVFLVFWIVKEQLPNMERSARATLFNNKTHLQTHVTADLQTFKSEYDRRTLVRGLASYSKLPVILFGYLAINFCSTRGDLSLHRKSDFARLRLNRGLAEVLQWLSNNTTSGFDISPDTTCIVCLTWVMTSWVRLAFVYMLFVFTATATIIPLTISVGCLIHLWRYDLLNFLCDYDEDLSKIRGSSNEDVTMTRNEKIVVVVLLTGAWVWEPELLDLSSTFLRLDACEALSFCSAALAVPILALLVQVDTQTRRSMMFGLFFLLAPFIGDNDAYESRRASALDKITCEYSEWEGFLQDWGSFYAQFGFLTLGFGWTLLGALLVGFVLEKFYNGAMKDWLGVNPDDKVSIDLAFIMLRSTETALPCCLAVVMVTEFALAFFVHYSVPFHIYAALEAEEMVRRAENGLSDSASENLNDGVGNFLSDLAWDYPHTSYKHYYDMLVGTFGLADHEDVQQIAGMVMFVATICWVQISALFTRSGTSGKADEIQSKQDVKSSTLLRLSISLNMLNEVCHSDSDDDESMPTVRFKQRTIYDTRLSSVFGTQGEPVGMEAKLLEVSGK